jgi:hypothetical protein
MSATELKAYIKLYIMLKDEYYLSEDKTMKFLETLRVMIEEEKQKGKEDGI